MVKWYDEDGETYDRYADKPLHGSGRGGYRPAAGRKPIEDGYTEKLYVRLSPEQKEKYFALGGSDWLRNAIKADYERHFTEDGYKRG